MSDQRKDGGLDWSKINLFAHGNYFAAVYYSKANAVQRHLLSVIASKLDVQCANPFDDPEARYINLDELQFMTALGRSTICDNLAILSGEVVKPLPSTDPTQLWLDKDGSFLGKEPTANQRLMFSGWAKNEYRVYVTRSRRFSEKTGLSEATSYGVTSQLIEDYREAIMAGYVLMNQEPNAKYLKYQESGSRTPGVREPDSGGPGAGLRGSGSRTLPPQEKLAYQAVQSPKNTVYNVVDNEVDKLVDGCTEGTGNHPSNVDGAGSSPKKAKVSKKAAKSSKPSKPFDDLESPALAFNLVEAARETVQPAYTYLRRNKPYIPGVDSYSLLNSCVAKFLDDNGKDVELLQSFGNWLMDLRNNRGERLLLKDFDNHVARWKAGESSKNPEFEKLHEQAEDSICFAEKARQELIKEQEENNLMLKKFDESFHAAIKASAWEAVYAQITRKLRPAQKADIAKADNKHAALIKVIESSYDLRSIIIGWLGLEQPTIKSQLGA